MRISYTYEDNGEVKSWRHRFAFHQNFCVPLGAGHTSGGIDNDYM